MTTREELGAELSLSEEFIPEGKGNRPGGPIRPTHITLYNTALDDQCAAYDRGDPNVKEQRRLRRLYANRLSASRFHTATLSVPSVNEAENFVCQYSQRLHSGLGSSV